MTRLCFLVVDPEHAGKHFVAQTGVGNRQFNVITAYSCVEAVETLERFPLCERRGLERSDAGGKLPVVL